MPIITKYAPGEFCWADLGTTDVTGAKLFYQALFGWKAKDVPMGNGEYYSIMRVSGKDACALYPMQDVQRKKKAPPSWLPYIAIKEVDATVKSAKAARGKVIMGPMDVMDQGRQAVMLDPSGAAFSIWQARKHYGAQISGKSGTICWHDLNTKKTSAASKFYSKVFGWKAIDQKYDGNAYHLFKVKRKNVGGMWPYPMKKLPSCWITYWQVASCAKIVAKAKRLGGRALLGTILVPEMCRFAILRDPQGAVFGVLEPL